MTYGERLRRYVLWAGFVVTCVFALCLLTGQPWFAMLYAYPVLLLAALLGLRVGLGAGALATGLAVLGGELAGGSPGETVYVSIGVVLIFFGGLGGLVPVEPRGPAGADDERSRHGSLLRKALAILFLIDLLGSMLGSVAAPAPASSSQLQHGPVFEQRLEVEADAPSAQCSTEAALMAALSGLLTSQQFELADVDVEHQGDYRDALRGLNALVAEPGPDQAEAREIASGLRGAVASDGVDAVGVVAALDACGDPLLGIRATAYCLHTLSSPLIEVAEGVERFADVAEEVEDIIELLQEKKRKASKTSSPA